MGTTQMTLLLVLTLALPACGGAVAEAGGAERTSRPEPPPAAEEKTIAVSEPAAPPEATAPSTTPAEPAPAPEKWTDLEASPGAAELEPGAAAVAAGEWVKARKQLGTALEKIRGTARLDEILAGQALLGRACVALKDTKAAEKAYGAVLTAWQGSETARKVLDAAGGDEAARKQRLQRALLAVGEALFFSAEQKRHAANRLAMPAYTGTGSRESVHKHIGEKVGPWVKQKQLLIEDAERTYTKIAMLEPAPPPRWVVGASARVGALWGRFVAEFRASPIPKEWTRSGPVPGGNGMTWKQVRTAYYEAMDSASEPQRRRARAAFQKCQSDAARFGYADELSKSCDKWLEKQP